MAIRKRLEAFFSLRRFAIQATWHPTDYSDSVTAAVLFDEPGEAALGDMIDSVGYVIRYPRDAFRGLREGETLDIEGVQYTVRRNPRPEPGTDGAVMIVELSRDELEEI